ncbi:MAG: hypothetical protein H7301_00915 [Cryobacterium sp.]|nr:hypothetical protein [Oligoflexia bacterium]
MIAPLRAMAYPPNVRHGYPSCTACHINPGGGGVLSAYGRELSREVQSTFGGEKETAFLYGKVPMPSWLDAGGNFRYLQIVTDTDQSISGRGFWMQGDLEGAAHLGPRWTVDATVGWKGNAEALDSDALIRSRRHFILYSLTDPFASGTQWAIRGGKYFPVYGIMPAEHSYQTRKGIGFDQGQESYNLEISEQNESGSTFLTPIFGKARDRSESDERGLAVTRYQTVAGNSRIGASLLFGRGVRQKTYDKRWTLGPNWIVAATKEIFWVGEFDYVFKLKEGLKTQRGYVFTHKLTYEPRQGIQISLLQDLSKTNVLDPKTLAWTVGPVLDFYPRPHFDIQLAANRVILPGNNPNFWVYSGVLHFYP